MKSYSLIFNLSFIITLGVILQSTWVIGQNVSDSAVAKIHIKGLVYDASTKLPVGAAQVQTLNQDAAATTNDSGIFVMELTSTTGVLMVKAFGYNNQEIALQGRQNIEIGLYADNFTDTYTEVVVLNGKVKSTQATSAIKSKGNLSNLAYTSVDDLIQSQFSGDVRGLSRSGVSGNGSSIFIRGLNTLHLKAQPLYVVDGIIWNNYEDITSVHDGFFINSLANIDVNDIESITVVKDGPSIYGAKGANGVIVIKTKRGVDMVTKITLNAWGGVTAQPASLPMMTSDQFRAYASDLVGTMGLSQEEISKIEYLNEDPSKSTYKKYHNNTDWDDQVYQLGKTQSYLVNVNGGDQRALYNFSLGYTGNKGVVKLTDMQRINTRFNADFSMTKKLTMELNVAFTNIDRTLFDDGVNVYTSPTYQAMAKSSFLSPYSYTTSGSLTGNFEDADIFGVGNPAAVIENSYEVSTNKQSRFNIGVKPEVKITPSLTFNSLFDYSFYNVNEWYYRPMIGSADVYLNGIDTSQNVIKNQMISNNSFFSESHLEYKKLFGNNHRLNATLGVRYLFDACNLSYSEGHNTGSDQLRNQNDNLDFRKTNGLDIDTKTMSGFANIDYNFDNRYFLSATLSADGSSRFGDEAADGFVMFSHSWGIFPSVNAAWLVSSEQFMSALPFIDLLKIRAGYGITGNDAIDPFAWTAYFKSVQFIDRAVAYQLVNIGNPSIQWETTKKLNVGFDINVLNNRLALSADIYKNSTCNLLHLKELPEVVEPGYYWSNGGELSNKGFEVSANLIMLNTNKFKWEFGAALGHYKNTIESLPDGSSVTSIYDANVLTKVGEAAGVFYGYKTAGVFATQAEADAANLKMFDAKGNELYFAAGDMHFVDQDNNGIINSEDMQIIGDPNPDFYGSFNNKFIYGNFTFNVLFTFSKGNDIYNYLRYNLESGNSLNNQTAYMLNRWSYEGQVTNQPKAYYNDPKNNARFSDRWIEDGSYLRLKSLSVNYQVPVKSSLIEGVNVWMSANNLFTLTKYLGRDPEVSAGNQVLYQGIDAGLIPTTKSFFIGIKLAL